MANGRTPGPGKTDDHSLGDVWSVVSAQGRAIVGVETKIDALASNVGTLTGQMTTLAQAFTANQKVQWLPIFSGLGLMASIIMGIGSLAAYGLNSNINRNEKAIIEVDRRAAENVLFASENARRSLEKEGRAIREEARLRDEVLAVQIKDQARRLVVIEAHILQKQEAEK